MTSTPTGPAVGERETGPAPGEDRAGRATPASGGPVPAHPAPTEPDPAPAESSRARAGRAGQSLTRASPAGPSAARAARRRRWLRTVLAILAAGAMVWVVVANRHTLGESLSALGDLDFRWFALAIVFEAVSLTAFGLSRRRLLRADGHQADFSSVMAITYAGNALSMAVPFAGAQLAAVFSYQQFRRRGLDPALTGWALGVSAIASSSALALILI